MTTPLGKIIWFLVFGVFTALLVNIGMPRAITVSIFLAYVLGGMTCFLVMMPPKTNPTKQEPDEHEQFPGDHSVTPVSE